MTSMPTLPGGLLLPRGKEVIRHAPHERRQGQFCSKSRSVGLFGFPAMLGFVLTAEPGCRSRAS